MNLFSRKPTLPETLLNIEGMNCSACVSHVSKALQGVAGATSVAVDLKKSQARVQGDVDTAALIAAVEKAGYNASTG